MLKIRVPASNDELFASLSRAYANGEAWLGYMWGPASPPAADLELTRLEEPPYSEVCWDTDKGCAYPVSLIRIVVNPSLMTSAPFIVEFLRNWDLPVNSQLDAERCAAAVVGSFQECAKRFLRNPVHEAVWTQWVPDAIADKVRKALAEQ